MSDMATHLRVMMPSVFNLWLALALYFVSICIGDVRDFVTEDFFNKIVSGDVPLSSDYGVNATEDLFIRNLFEIPDSCEGYGFYTYDDFINATNAFSGFGTTGTSGDKKREIAAFFGNIAHETRNLCYVQQINRSRYCSNNSEYPCTSGRQYYGRGPLQLRGNANYGAAGAYLDANLLNNPGLVAQDDLISWKTALWLWNVNSNCHTSITSGRGFGATIHALSGVNGFAECNGASTSVVNSRVYHYTNYCSQLGVDPGSNLSC